MAQKYNHLIRIEDMDFIGKLMHEHPELTKTELSICALVERGMTSREIASLLGCSLRNIENHRYRIGRKMRCDKSTNFKSGDDALLPYKSS